MDTGHEITEIGDVLRFAGEYDGFIFDLDDTLYNEVDYIRSGYRAVTEAFPEISGLDGLLWEAYLRGEKAFDTVIPAVGLDPGRVIPEALSIYREHMPRLSLSDEVRNVLLRLRETHRVGIITDGRPEGQENKLRALGIYELISPEDIVITDLLGGPGMRKPNPAAYRLLQERWGIPFFRLVYIGDNPAKDFTAPKELGMGYLRYMNTQGIYWER